MPKKILITIELTPEVSRALDRMATDIPTRTREQAAASAIHDWLISAGYLPYNGVEEDTPTEGES